MLRLLSLMLAACCAVSAATGLFWERRLDLPELTNVHGLSVPMFEQGLYARESAFMGPIHLATDGFILFLVLPLFLLCLNRGTDQHSKIALLHAGLTAMLTYYAVSASFGLAYNELFPLYLVMFSTSFFCLIVSLLQFSSYDPGPDTFAAIPRRGLSVFLCFAGLSVLVWLAEILPASWSGVPPHFLGMSSTGVTFLLDIGVIAPVSFTAAYMVWTKQPFGLVLAAVLLICYALIGVLVILQSLFQRAYGVEIELMEIILFVAIFIAMSMGALLLLSWTYRALPEAGLSARLAARRGNER